MTCDSRPLLGLLLIQQFGVFHCKASIPYPSSVLLYSIKSIQQSCSEILPLSPVELILFSYF